MQNPIRSIARRLMSAEEPWNPKVLFGRVVLSVLPDSALHAFKKPYYYRILKYRLDHQELDCDVVKHLVSPGDFVIDVGASIGGYTRFLSELVGPQGRVYSFEPVPATFDFLAHNTRKLGLSNVELIPSAVSDREGSSTMVIPKWRWGADCYYDAQMEADPVAPGYPALRPDWRSMRVTMTTLDSCLGDVKPRITFIKCDTNFHELECFRGALRTLRDSKPALLVEVAYNPDDPSTKGAETFGLLRSVGYEPYWFDGRALHARHPGETSQNYFFLTAAHIDALRKQQDVRLALD